jgi:hypothetical protein
MTRSNSAFLVVGLLVSEAAFAAGWLDAPAVPAAIKVPDGAKLVARFHATGAQVYACAAGSPTGYAWALKRPDASLHDEKGAVAGSHGAGPSWTSSKDGSSVTAKKAAQADAPAPDAIPWLLLEATGTAGKGVFAGVTHVQRVNTKGGKAPAGGCDAAASGSEKRVDYSADYYFYRAAAAAPK